MQVDRVLGLRAWGFVVEGDWLSTVNWLTWADITGCMLLVGLFGCTCGLGTGCSIDAPHAAAAESGLWLAPLSQDMRSLMGKTCHIASAHKALCTNVC